MRSTQPVRTLVVGEVEEQRDVAAALLELRTVFTRVRLLLPSLSLAEVISLSGIVEQAVTLGMKRQQKAATVKEKIDPSNFPAGSVTDVKTQRGPMSVIQGKTRVPVLDAAEEVLKANGPMTAPEILSNMRTRGWVIFTMQKNVVGALRGAISNSDRFARSGEGKKTKYRVAGSPTATPPRGLVPGSLFTSMVEVMPVEKNLTAPEIQTLLEEGKLLGDYTQPANYIRTTLCQNPKTFKRISRGVYHLRKSAKMKIETALAVQALNGDNKKMNGHAPPPAN